VQARESTKKEHRPPVAFLWQPKRDLHGIARALLSSEIKEALVSFPLISHLVPVSDVFSLQTLMALVALPSLAAGLSNLPFYVRKCIHLLTLATTCVHKVQTSGCSPMHVLMEADES
jgi:hypothetical protein